MSLSLPVRVQGHLEDGSAWTEMTTSEDASFGGASFVLKHPVPQGQALYLSLPLPKRFRRYDLTEPSYHVYAVVRDISGPRVGVMFLGKHAPKGYGEGSRYLLPSDPHPQAAPAADPKERRQQERRDLFLNLKLRRETNAGDSQEERTVAENLSKGGARVLTSLAVAKGEVLVLEEMGGDFQTRVEIRGVYIGKDGVPRLNLRFLDALAPDRLIDG